MTTIIGGRRIHPVTMALPEMEPEQYEGLKRPSPLDPQRRAGEPTIRFAVISA